MDKKQAMRIIFEHLPTPAYLDPESNRRLDEALETVEEALELAIVFPRGQDYTYVDKATAEHLTDHRVTRHHVFGVLP